MIDHFRHVNWRKTFCSKAWAQYHDDFVVDLCQIWFCSADVPNHIEDFVVAWVHMGASRSHFGLNAWHFASTVCHHAMPSWVSDDLPDLWMHVPCGQTRAICRASFCSHRPRPGHIVLFQLPARKDHCGVELGMVLSVWKGIKCPKLHTGETAISACPGFRVVALASKAGCGIYSWEKEVWWQTCAIFFTSDGNFEFLRLQLLQESNRVWCCSSTSLAWVLRIESLVSILDCQECLSAALRWNVDKRGANVQAVFKFKKFMRCHLTGFAFCWHSLDQKHFVVPTLALKI